jgi:hypothetical protein
LKLSLNTALICLCSVGTKTRICIYYSAPRTYEPAPHAKLLLGIWSEDEGEILSGLENAVGADAVGTLHQVLSIIVLDATEQKLSGERGRVDQARQDDHLVER